MSSAVPGDPAHDLHPSKVCERPKVVFNARTKKFVMWMHIDSEDYKAARAGVAVADWPTGPFRYIESVRPEGQDSRDQTLFQDDDGKAYRIYSSEKNPTTYISLLTDDYLKHSGKFVRVFDGRNMEAQVVFKRAGKYWFIASGCTGWAPNAARSAVADSIWGPWTELGNPCRGPEAEITFRGQSTFVCRSPGERTLSSSWPTAGTRTTSPPRATSGCPSGSSRDGRSSSGANNGTCRFSNSEMRIAANGSNT